jgi:hypothetical protein
MTLKRSRFWLAPIGLILVLLTVLLGRILLPIWQHTSARDAALRLVETAPTGPEWLRWLPDDAASPRTLEPSRRDEIGFHYLLAQRELEYARVGEDVSGLRTYFQDGALRDALEASSQPRARVVNWDHQMRLHFYAPDGATVSFTDTHWSVQALETGEQIPPKFEDVRFSRRSVDVVMQLDDGNWRVHHWRVTSDRTLERDRTFPNLAATLAEVRGANFVGRSHPFDDFWPNFDPVEVRSSFALAAQLKLNTVRIFIPQPVPVEAIQHLPELLETARTSKLRVIVTLLDTYTAYKLEDLPQVWHGLNRLLPALQHPSVLAIDVKNEAERDVKRAGWPQIRGVLGFLATWLRSETGKPVTAGLSDPDAELSRSLDFVTVHHYGTAQALETRLTNAQITRKPVLLEEFGFHTWRGKFPDPHTESEQAEHYAKTLEITRRERIGFLAWTLHDFPQGSMPGARGVERHLGIARADGSLKPVAFVLLDEPLPPREWWDRFLKLEAFFPVILFGMLTLVVVLLLIGRGLRLLLLKRIFKRHTERPG